VVLRGSAAVRSLRLDCLVGHNRKKGSVGFALVAAFTVMEKFLEFGGQALQVFPPQETLGGTSVRSVVDAIWDQMFFVLWFCNTLGAAAAGFLMFRLARRPLNLAAAGFAWSAAFLTLIMLLGKEYVGLNLPMPGTMLFFVVFVGYRMALALTLATGVSRGRFSIGVQSNKSLEPIARDPAER
jgi:hypothetical protein